MPVFYQAVLKKRSQNPGNGMKKDNKDLAMFFGEYKILCVNC